MQLYRDLFDETASAAKIGDSIPVRSHHSKVRVFTIPAFQVQTGTQTRTSMHCDAQYVY